MKSITSKGLITSKELAEYCGVSPRTVARWIEDGVPALNLAAGKKRRMLRFKLTDVEKWHEEREQIAAR